MMKAGLSLVLLTDGFIAFFTWIICLLWVYFAFSTSSMLNRNHSVSCNFSVRPLLFAQRALCSWRDDSVWQLEEVSGLGMLEAREVLVAFWRLDCCKAIILRHGTISPIRDLATMRYRTQFITAASLYTLSVWSHNANTLTMGRC